MSLHKSGAQKRKKKKKRADDGRRELQTLFHRRSRGGGAKEPCPPKFLENIVILWFQRRFSKQNSVIRLK